MSTHDPHDPPAAYCAKTHPAYRAWHAYSAVRLLRQHGLDACVLSGGWSTHLQRMAVKG